MALNPIIEAFLAAREQASRDFSQGENRRLQSEAQKAQEKHQEEVLKQQLAISQNELAQRKAMDDAHNLLTKQNLDLTERTRKLQALNTLTQGVAAGTMKPPTKEVLNPDFLRVGQPTTQEEPDIESWVSALAPVLGGNPQEVENMIKLMPQYGQKHKQAMEAEAAKRKLMADAKAEEQAALFGHQNQLQEGNLISQEARAAADREARRVEGELNRASRERQNSARISARAASDDASIVIPEGYASDFISARSSSRDLNQLTAKEKSAFSKAYKGAGYTFYTPEELTQLSRIATMGKTVQNVDRLVKLYDEGYEKHAAEIDALNGSIRAVIGNVSRAIAGEKGVLTQPDVERIIGLLPTGWDEAKSGFWNMFAKKNQKFSIAKEKVGQLKEHVKLNYGHLFRGRRPDQVQSVLKQYGAENLGLADELERTFDAAGNETTGGRK